jgi:hypothetical protein
LDLTKPEEARRKVCIVYDCLYPYTIGGAEKWYRELASTFVIAGDEVTYLTRRQWEKDDPPIIEGVEVVAVMGPADLYDRKGNRRIIETLRFGFGVFRHLLRYRGRYDVVHLCAFPYFSLIGSRVALIGTRATIGVDWFEVWSARYWAGYLGPLLGRLGLIVQRCCIRLTPTAFAYSDLAAGRLVADGARRPPVRLRGMHPGDISPTPGPPGTTSDGLVLWIGRLIPEKRATLVPSVMARLRTTEQRSPKPASAMRSGPRGSSTAASSRRPSGLPTACWSRRGAKDMAWWSSKRRPAARRLSWWRPRTMLRPN